MLLKHRRHAKDCKQLGTFRKAPWRNNETEDNYNTGHCPAKNVGLAMWDMDSKIRTVQFQMTSDQKKNRKRSSRQTAQSVFRKSKHQVKTMQYPSTLWDQRAISGPVLPATQLLAGRPSHAGHAIWGFLRVSEARDFTSILKATTYQPIITTSK